VREDMVAPLFYEGLYWLKYAQARVTHIPLASVITVSLLRHALPGLLTFFCDLSGV
jgi:hypothetical protein